MFSTLRKLASFIACYLGTSALALAQAAAEAGKTAAAPGTVVHKTLWQTIEEGGWVMIPLGLCSVATLWLIVDGSLRTSSKKLTPKVDLEKAREYFRAGDYVGSYQYAKNTPSSFNSVVRAGLAFVGEGKTMTEEALINEITRIQAGLNARIVYLSVLGVCTPMIGLVGTVTGMIKAFATLGTSGIGDPSKLSAAIGEVLVATASGLFVAIPAFMAFYFLKNRITQAIHGMEEDVAGLFRGMPYDLLAGQKVGEEEVYAAAPVWGEQQASQSQS